MTALAILHLNHSFRYQRELEGDAEVGAALGKRALALIYAGCATYETFRFKPGTSLADLANLVTDIEARVPRFWLGRRTQDDLICYASPTPLKRWRTYRFTSAIGPFLSRLSAAYYVRCQDTCQISWTPSDIECKARQDNNPVWASIRENILYEESLTACELHDERQDQAEEFEHAASLQPDSINISMMLRNSVGVVEFTENAS
jgi:hypothetical protein